MEDTVPAESFSVIHHYSLQILASVSSHFNFFKKIFVQAENFAAPTFRGSKHENKSSLLLSKNPFYIPQKTNFKWI